MTTRTDGLQKCTTIYRFTANGEVEAGYIGPDSIIYSTQFGRQIAVGRVDEQRIFRYTEHDERELGTFGSDGHIRSHGLFEGGELGWLDADGTVIQGGLIFGEEEIGRVDGPQACAAAAALLLLFAPDAAESKQRMER